MPLISVLMPAYNCEKYIGSAISSILSQTLSDFELIILNDGSVDSTEQIIDSINDKRIKYYKNEINKGLTYTRNKLIELSNCEFLAFLDSDDLAEKNRLDIEYNALVADPALAFVSNSFKAINEDGKIIEPTWKFDLSPNELRVHFLFYNPIATSSVLIKKSTLPQIVFREGYPVCEDYDLWTRVIQKWGGRVLPQILTGYRLYNESICKQQPDNIIKIRNKIIFNQLEMYFPGQYTEEEALTHLSLADFTVKNNLEDLSPLKSWIYKLIKLNYQYEYFDKQILNQVLYERILKKFIRLNAYNYSVFQTLMQLKSYLKPALSFELRKKEMAILAFSLMKHKFIEI